MSQSDVTVYEYPSHKRKKIAAKEIETVVIDDNESLQTNQKKKLEEVVEILSDDDEGLQITTSSNTSLFEEILTKGGLFAEVIEKCLELEHSDGMERIVKKTLLRYYCMADKSYLASSKFSKDLLRTLRNLENDPQHKFSYIKCLCDVLKSSQNKKRVNLITLETNLKDKTKIPSKSKKMNSNKSNVDVIEIDDLEMEDNNMEVINLDEYQSDGLGIDEREKENERLPNSQEHSRDTLLTPQKVVPYTQLPTVLPDPAHSSQEIPRLEAEITNLHKKIKLYEEQEVTNDSELGSQYVTCERLKNKLVGCYKVLCRLTGNIDKKHKRIKLHVTEGHPRGPTKMLQKFINERIGGEFYFPDMMDVVTCVKEGLKADELSWTMSQIMKEASALFVQCGRALQKCRQQREWKHLLYLVKEQHTWEDDDPAARDPELMAKLELNRMLAEQKESDLINKYATLQDLPVTARSISTLTDKIVQDEEHDSETETNQDYVPTTSSKTSINNNEPNLDSNQIEDNRIIKILDNQNNAKQFIYPTVNDHTNISTISTESNQTQNKEIQNGHKKETQIKITNCKGYLEISVAKHSETAETENVVHNNMEDSEDCGRPQMLDKDVSALTENGHTYKNDASDNNGIPLNEESIDNCHVEIKTEPTEEIANLLESLGDNYTVSIVDVEDPFLIIEISSDSDSDDESNDHDS